MKRLEDAAEPSDTSFKVYWKDGLRLDTTDGLFKLKIGGRIQNDWAWLAEDGDVKAAIGDQEDGTEFRRARLYLSGEIYKNTFFKTQFDFAGGDVDFKDVYLGYKGIPGIGHIKVGHFKEPFSLEELTSSNYITFMERSLPNVFSPGRNTGISIYNTEFDERLTWAAGVFRDTDDFGNGKEEGGFSTSFRLTGLPWYEESGARLLHIGAAYSLRSPDDDTIRFRERPEVHLADRFVDTGTFSADRIHQFGLESALVLGPFSMQSEYIQASVDAETVGDPTFSGFYGSASYFLTGEHRNYKKSSGAFDRVRPKKNFGEDGGLGAWEVAVRYSTVDLNDGLVSGGQLSNMSAGLNWYLNPNTRVIFNYIFADIKDVGDSDALTIRFQINF